MWARHFIPIWIGLLPVSSLADTTIPDPSSILSPTIASAIVKTIGLAMDHRPYEPATPLAKNLLGFDFGIEATMTKPPEDLSTAISSITSASGGGGSTSIPILPSARLHLSKSLGSRLDIGISYLPAVSSIPVIGGSSLFGGDLKLCLADPEEGVTWALRASYNINTIKISTITVNTTTFSPQLLISKKLEFADPYMGIGVQYTTGTVTASITPPSIEAPAPVLSTISLSEKGSGFGGVFFSGISLKIPLMNLRITLEGAYSTARVSYMGTKVGFNF
jgi:hypothetical protein